MNWQSLKVRYAVATIMLLILLIATVSTRYIITKFNEDTGFLIDTAGGQRMRAVRLAYLANRHQANPTQSFRIVIEDALTDYQIRMDALKKGNAFGIQNGVTSGRTKEKLVHGIKAWEIYKLLVQEALAGRYDGLAVDDAMQRLVSSMDGLSKELADELNRKNTSAFRIQLSLAIIAIILAALYILTTNYYLIKPLMEIRMVLEKYSAGDLSVRMRFLPSFLGIFEFKDEVYRIREGLNAAIENTGNIIKDTKEKNEELKTSYKNVYELEQMLASIFNGIRDYIIFMDKDYKIVEANNAFLMDMGLTMDMIRGRDCCYAICNLKQEPEGCIFRELLCVADGQSFEVQLWIHGRGKLFQIYSFLRKDGNGGILAYMRDITEEAKLKERLLSSEKLSYIGYLSAGFAHEINNPLTSVMGFTELLLSSEIDQSKIKRLTSIYEAAGRCQKVVQNLMAFSSGGIGQKALTDINMLVEGALKLTANQLKAMDISVNLELDRGLKEVMVDPFHIEHALAGLMSNSIDAIKKGKGEKAICIRTSNTKKGVRIEVMDTGCGIPESNKDKIFIPFFSTKNVSSGAGLGLSTLHRIIKEHNGTITFTSKEGEGTTFIIELPLS